MKKRKIQNKIESWNEQNMHFTKGKCQFYKRKAKESLLLALHVHGDRYTKACELIGMHLWPLSAHNSMFYLGMRARNEPTRVVWGPSKAPQGQCPIRVSCSFPKDNDGFGCRIVFP